MIVDRFPSGRAFQHAIARPATQRTRPINASMMCKHSSKGLLEKLGVLLLIVMNVVN